MEDQNQNNDPEKKPVKKKKVSKKPASRKKPADIAKQSSFDYAALSALFADPKNIAYRKNVKLMCGQLEEYMDSYILIGYNMQGESVTVTHSPSQQGYDALSTNLQKYVFDSLHNNQMPPGNPL